MSESRGPGSTPANKKIKLILALAAAVVLVVVGVITFVIATSDDDPTTAASNETVATRSEDSSEASASTSPETASSSTTGGGRGEGQRDIPPGTPPDGLGDDPVMNALAQSCFEGVWTACDDLYFGTDIDSPYRTYGDTCGGRLGPEELDGFCEITFFPSG